MPGPMLAIDLALEAARQPKQLMRKVATELPPDMIDVIKCAAGDETTLAKCAEGRNITSHKVQDAARVFLQHLITHANGNDRTILGLRPGHAREDVREHKRWMLKWLHPDRNPSKWETALFQRVKEASERLENGTAKETTVGPAPNLFRRGNNLRSQKHAKRPVPKPSATVAQPARLRKRDILRLLLVPMLLAACVALAAGLVWLRFGPRGEY